MANLDMLFWMSICVSAVLLCFTLMSLGKTVHDIVYQRVRKLNGIRKLQSYVNLRTDGNRVLLAFVGTIISIAALMYESDYFFVLWFSRLLLLGVLTVFMASAVFDFITDIQQMKLLLKTEEVNNIGKIRISLHALSNKLGELYGYLDTDIPENHHDRIRINLLEEQIITLIKTIQHDVHEMDPSFVVRRYDAPTKN